MNHKFANRGSKLGFEKQKKQNINIKQILISIIIALFIQWTILENLDGGKGRKPQLIKDQECKRRE